MRNLAKTETVGGHKCWVVILGEEDKGSTILMPYDQAGHERMPGTIEVALEVPGYHAPLVLQFEEQEFRTLASTIEDAFGELDKQVGTAQ